MKNTRIRAYCRSFDSVKSGIVRIRNDSDFILAPRTHSQNVSFCSVGNNGNPFDNQRRNPKPKKSDISSFKHTAGESGADIVYCKKSMSAGS